MNIDWGVTSTFVLAIVAVGALVVSLVFSTKTNKNTKEMHTQNKALLKHQNNIALFDKRYELYQYFTNLFLNPETFRSLLKSFKDFA